MNKLEGGYWVGSINTHGVGASAYHLFTGWHIDVKETIVRVVYVNYAKASKYYIGDFLSDTEDTIREWGINFIWILQDAKDHQEKTVLPLLHFINHFMNYFRNVIISYRGRFAVHIGSFVTEILTLLAPMQQLLNRIKVNLGGA